MQSYFLKYKLSPAYDWYNFKNYKGLFMGWTCQHDYKGECKLVKKPCLPGMKGCTLKSSEYIFNTPSFEEDKKADEDKKQEIDFAALARSN